MFIPRLEITRKRSVFFVTLPLGIVTNDDWGANDARTNRRWNATGDRGKAKSDWRTTSIRWWYDRCHRATRARARRPSIGVIVIVIIIIIIINQSINHHHHRHHH